MSTKVCEMKLYLYRYHGPTLGQNRSCTFRVRFFTNFHTISPLFDLWTRTVDIFLAETFSNFFVNEIETIRQSFDMNTTDSICTSTIPAPNVKENISVFQPACEDEIRNIIMKSPSKSCELDPVPTSLIKQCIYIFVPWWVFSEQSKGCTRSSTPEKGWPW